MCFGTAGGGWSPPSFDIEVALLLLILLLLLLPPLLLPFKLFDIETLDKPEMEDSRTDIEFSKLSSVALLFVALVGGAFGPAASGGRGGNGREGGGCIIGLDCDGCLLASRLLLLPFILLLFARCPFEDAEDDETRSRAANSGALVDGRWPALMPLLLLLLPLSGDDVLGMAGRGL